MEVRNKKTFCYVSALGRERKEVVAFRQAKSLKDAGYDVKFIYFDKGPELIDNDIEILSVGYNPGGYLKRIFIGPFFLLKKLIAVNANIYQTNSLDHILIFLILKLLGKKIIFFLRESHPYTIYSKTNKIPKKILKVFVYIMSLYMKHTLKFFDALFTVSEDILLYIRKWNIQKSFIIGNYPYINEKFKLSYDEYLNRKNCILYQGSIYNISCQDELLTALSRIDDIKYILAGKFWNNEDYHEKLKNNPGWKKVEFIDGFNVSELSGFYSRSTIANVLRDFSKTNSKNGSLGIIKIFESMEEGLPLICADVPVYRKLMSEYKCGILVDPVNVDQIEKAIRTLITDKRKAYDMGQEGRRAVIEKYSWNVESKKYISVINKIFN